MNKKEFYEKCAEIIGVTSEYTARKSLRRYNRETDQYYDTGKFNNRWGGREPGNGRFPGVGTIRDYGSTIHISFNKPKFSGTYNSYEDVLRALQEIFISETNELKIGDFIPVVLNGEDYGECEIVAYDELYQCWKIQVRKTYPNGYIGVSERFYLTDNS